jgi:hypothetical protein
VHDQDGGGAMALGLVIGPVVAVIGGMIGALIIYRWYAKRQLTLPPPNDADTRRDTKRFAIIGGAIVSAVFGHYIAQFGFWLASPIQFDSYWKVIAITWIPTLLTMLSAICGAIAVQRWVRGFK